MNTLPANPHRQYIWDPLVRLFHWSLVACVLANLLLLEEGDPPHRWAGYIASALVLIRIVWGFVGSHHARFASFLPTPVRLRHHLQQLRSGTLPHSDGHNPLGALMMLALMALVLSLGATGYLMGTDAYWGEEWLEALHEGLANTLMLAVGLHAAAAIVMGKLEKVNLVRAMVTGYKTWRG